MMQHPEIEGTFLVYDVNDHRAAEAIRSRWPVISENDGCGFASCSLVHLTSFAAELASEGLEVSVRYLDRYHLISDPRRERGRLPLSVLFFERIASEYDSLVSVDRNRSNVRILLDILLTGLAERSTEAVVDFGCGTGLALEVAQSVGVNVLGIDASERMRAAARGRGMLVYSVEEVHRNALPPFMGVFSSYVLHLLDRPDELLQLWRLLPPEGRLVANFHKGRNIERVTGWLLAAGATVNQSAPTSDSQTHGTYVSFAKRT